MPSVYRVKSITCVKERNQELINENAALKKTNERLMSFVKAYMAKDVDKIHSLLQEIINQVHMDETNLSNKKYTRVKNYTQEMKQEILRQVEVAKRRGDPITVVLQRYGVTQDAYMKWHILDKRDWDERKVDCPEHNPIRQLASGRWKVAPRWSKWRIKETQATKPQPESQSLPTPPIQNRPLSDDKPKVEWDKFTEIFLTKQ